MKNSSTGDSESMRSANGGSEPEDTGSTESLEDVLGGTIEGSVKSFGSGEDAEQSDSIMMDVVGPGEGHENFEDFGELEERYGFDADGIMDNEGNLLDMTIGDSPESTVLLGVTICGTVKQGPKHKEKIRLTDDNSRPVPINFRILRELEDDYNSETSIMSIPEPALADITSVAVLRKLPKPRHSVTRIHGDELELEAIGKLSEIPCKYRRRRIFNRYHHAILPPPFEPAKRRRCIPQAPSQPDVPFRRIPPPYTKVTPKLIDGRVMKDFGEEPENVDNEKGVFDGLCTEDVHEGDREEQGEGNDDDSGAFGNMKDYDYDDHENFPIHENVPSAECVNSEVDLLSEFEQTTRMVDRQDAYWLGNYEHNGPMTAVEQLRAVKLFFEDIGCRMPPGAIDITGCIAMHTNRFAIAFTMSESESFAIKRRAIENMFDLLHEYNSRRFGARPDEFVYYVSLSHGTTQLATLQKLHNLLPHFANTFEERSWIVMNGAMAAMMNYNVHVYTLDELILDFPGILHKAHKSSTINTEIPTSSDTQQEHALAHCESDEPTNDEKLTVKGVKEERFQFWVTNWLFTDGKGKDQQVLAVESFLGEIGLDVPRGAIHAECLRPMSSNRYGIMFSVNKLFATTTLIPTMQNMLILPAIMDWNVERNPEEHFKNNTFVSLSKAETPLKMINSIYRLLPFFTEEFPEQLWMYYDGTMVSSSDGTMIRYTLEDLKNKFGGIVHKALLGSNPRQHQCLVSGSLSTSHSTGLNKT